MKKITISEACDGCGICVDICPNDVYRMGADEKPIVAYAEDCHTCFQCETDCPLKAIWVSGEVLGTPVPY